MSISGLDLNLLRNLQAILEQRNVTRAGERLHLSQPAMSAALARLRRHFDDDLLVRNGREYQLTPLGQALLPLVTDALVQTQMVFDVRSTFDPGTSDRRFFVNASDYATCMITEPLRARISTQAPGVSIEFGPMPDSALEVSALTNDLLIAPVGYGVTGPHDIVIKDRFVGIIDSANPALRGSPSTVELLRSLPHAVGRFGKGITTPADRLLEELGVTRQVGTSVNGLLALPMMVMGTDLIALVPSRLAHRYAPLGRLTVLELHAEQAPLVEAAFWDARRAVDPALQWLRDTITRACKELTSEPPVSG